MKQFILAFTLLATQSVFAARHMASEFMNDGLNEAIRIIQLPDQTERMSKMCAHLGEKVNTENLAAMWLGEFAELERDQQAVTQFRGMIPAILIHKIFGSLKGQAGKLDGSFEVNEDVLDRGNDTFAVPVTLISGAGNRYLGYAIVVGTANNLKLVDVEYQGYSAAVYQGAEFNTVMSEEYEKDEATSMPVSALVQRLHDEGMEDCP